MGEVIPFVLFADISSAQVPWWVTVIMSAVSGAGGFLIPLALKLRKDRRDENVEDRTAIRQNKKEDRDEVIAGQREIIERQKRIIDEDRKTYKADLEELHTEVDALRTKLDKTITRLGAAERAVVKYQMQVGHLEEILEGRGIPFRKLKDTDSGTIRIPPSPTQSDEEEAF